jgi:predicted nucleic acid-binding protein
VNVFVETNFVLELALEQADAPSCEALLDLAQKGAIRLLVPAYSFIEPHEMLTRRHRDREALRFQISTELKQLGRSASLAERVAASQEVVQLLADGTQYETSRIEEVKDRLWSIGEVLACDASVLRASWPVRYLFDLSPQDAVIYASIRLRLDTDHAAPSCFASRNPADFDDPELRKDLASRNCKYFASFATALDYIRHELPPRKA